MNTINEVRELQAGIDEMRNLAKHNPRTSILGKEFLIYSEVFHPCTAPDIKQFLAEEKKNF